MERGFVLTVVLILVVSMFASNLNTRITGSFTHHKPPMELVGDLVVGHYLGPAPAILKYFFPPDPPKPPLWKYISFRRGLLLWNWRMQG